MFGSVESQTIDMSLVSRVIIHRIFWIFKENEPWNWYRRNMQINCIYYFGSNGDVTLRGDDDFYNIILNDNIKVEYKDNVHFYTDDYFCDLTFKSAVFNKSIDYQYPKFSELHLHSV